MNTTDDIAMKEFRELCSAHDSKCTSQRFAVYKYMRGNTAHPAVDCIWAAVKKEIPTITRESVFRILTELAQWGVIYRMDKICSARFDGDPGNHGHLICRVCGKVFDVPLPENLPQPVPAAGFKPEHVELRISGLCADCAATAGTREEGENPPADADI